jgi:hypothetical protein
MINLGFIKLIVEVVANPFHLYLICGYCFYIIFKVEIPTLLGFGLMAMNKSLLIMQFFCFHVTFALLCRLVVFTFSTSLILSLSIFTCYCNPLPLTMSYRLP